MTYKPSEKTCKLVADADKAVGQRPEPKSACVQCKRNQFKLYYVFPDGTEELATNEDYRIIDIKTGAVISKGKSDGSGLFIDSVYGEQPDKVRIHIDYEMNS
jgi:hypothetical protein